MTIENLKKQYKHLLELIEGKIKTSNPVRDNLIISDAKKTLKRLLKKFPELEEKNSKSQGKK